jgi:hypothetical protein
VPEELFDNSLEANAGLLTEKGKGLRLEPQKM